MALGEALLGLRDKIGLAHQQLLSGVPESEHDDPSILLARRHSMLPVIADLGGVVGVTTNGEIVSIDWDGAVAVPGLGGVPEHLFRVLAAQRYEQLGSLMPTRRPDSVVCAYCNGRGSPYPEVSNLVCRCGGLGWLPPGRECSHPESAG